MKSISLVLAVFLLFALIATFANAEDVKKPASSGETEGATEAESSVSDFDFEQLMKLIQALKDQDVEGALKMAGDGKESKDSKETQESSETKESNETKEAKESKESQESKEAKESVKDEKGAG